MVLGLRHGNGSVTQDFSAYKRLLTDTHLNLRTHGEEIGHPIHLESEAQSSHSYSSIVAGHISAVGAFTNFIIAVSALTASADNLITATLVVLLTMSKASGARARRLIHPRASTPEKCLSASAGRFTGPRRRPDPG
ncbi:hypothetical protein C8Q74DRAFT_672199 [Fomes fomentarius]|nr:hypothetical protein C8Q74DRAFT_672199 [Fomes fomentarius]